MLIETFDAGAAAVYARFHAQGRMLPEGLEYIDSWVTADQGGCFQIMRTEDLSLLQAWMAEWQDLVSFQVVPIISSQDMQSQIYAMQQVSTRGGS